MCADWGYTDVNGPNTWAERFPDAAGERQSPVDIDTSVAASDATLVDNPLTWSYSPDCCMRIVNTGYGWRVDVNGETTELKGGPLSEAYKLEQFHCHWGPNSSEGSEHTVDGKAYAGELHLVHWNCEKYDSFKEAAGNSDGLAVLGIFFEAGETEHEELGKVIASIPDIINRGQTVPITSDIDPTAFLPGTQTYWTYLGSLTTPPCSEVVTWIVFKDPITVSEDQLEAFRNIKIVQEEEEENDDVQLRLNYRPPQPLGNRVVRECGSN